MIRSLLIHCPVGTKVNSQGWNPWKEVKQNVKALKKGEGNLMTETVVLTGLIEIKYS